MANNTVDVGKEDKLSSTQLRRKREKIYRQKIPRTNVFPNMHGKVLSSAVESARKNNFLIFVDMYFYKEVHKKVVDPDFGTEQFPTKLLSTSDGYKAFQRFSTTDYGSSVIKEMITNTKKYQGFVIAEGYKRGAKANYGVMLLPKRFPAPPGLFKTSGQKIYDLAIIYHEFAHTAAFRSASTSDAAITIFDERLAVMNFENPVRIRMGYEPRYSYTKGNGIATINIITGKKVVGERTVSKYDPTILVELNDKDALK